MNRTKRKSLFYFSLFCEASLVQFSSGHFVSSVRLYTTFYEFPVNFAKIY